MKTVAVTQRVVVDPPHGTRRDCLDQVWLKFLLKCGLVPIPIPNSVEAALKISEQVMASSLPAEMICRPMEATLRNGTKPKPRFWISPRSGICPFWASAAECK